MTDQMKMNGKIPVVAAERIATGYRLNQVLLIGWDGSATHVVTYGITRDDCEKAAQAQDFWAGHIREMSFRERVDGDLEAILIALNEALNRVWEVFDDAESGLKSSDGEDVVQTPESGFIAACEALDALEEKLPVTNGWLGYRVAMSLRGIIASRLEGGEWVNNGEIE